MNRLIKGSLIIQWEVIEKMNLIGQKVKSVKLGEGTIVRQDEENNGKEYIIIKFEAGEKKFQYPESFRHYLRFIDNNLQNEVEQLLNKEVVIPTPIPVEKTVFPPFYSLYMDRDVKLSFEEVENKFKIKIRGFGRGINITPDAIILISKVAKNKNEFVYHDYWTKEEDYIYSGEGKIGDQLLTRGNAAIANAASVGKKIHLLIKMSSKEYYYQGEFKVIDYYQEIDVDEEGKSRKEYKFRLRKV